MWGTAIAAGGALIGGQAAAGESREQNRNLGRYDLAFRHYGARSQENETRQIGRQGALSAERYIDLEALADALKGPQRTAAGGRARTERAGRIDGASLVARGKSAPRVSGPMATRWAGASRAFHEPVIAARRERVLEGAAQQGMSDHDDRALATLAERQVDVGRRSAEADRYASLLQAFYDRGLAEDAQRFRYTGPSNGFYNAQMLSQLMQTAGTGIDSYRAYR